MQGQKKPQHVLVKLVLQPLPIKNGTWQSSCRYKSCHDLILQVFKTLKFFYSYGLAHYLDSFKVGSMGLWAFHLA